MLTILKQMPKHNMYLLNKNNSKEKKIADKPNLLYEKKTVESMLAIKPNQNKKKWSLFYPPKNGLCAIFSVLTAIGE